MDQTENVDDDRSDDDRSDDGDRRENDDVRASQSWK